jgi:dipeptidyl aminopeptidase/acylaminoacyl peptidase
MGSYQFLRPSRMLLRSALVAALAIVFLSSVAVGQSPDTAPEPVLERPELSVSLIMQEPRTWIGAWPSEVFWTLDGEHAYFSWNPRGEFPADSLFRVRAGGGPIEQVAAAERRRLPPRFDGWHVDRHSYSPDFRRRVFERQGDLFLYDLSTATLRHVTHDRATDQNPRFSLGRDDRIVFTRDDNAYALDFSGDAPAFTRLTDLRSGAPPADPELEERQRFLEEQQLDLFDVLREKARLDSLARASRVLEEEFRMLPPTFHYGERQVQQLQVSPGERFATFVLARIVEPEPTSMTDYVTRTGYAAELTARPKVGAPGSEYELVIQDLRADTSYTVDLTTLPGAFEPADYQRARGVQRDTLRTFLPFGPYWSHDGRQAVLDVRTRDNKDRWIARLDLETGAVTSLYHHRDDAWIAGPGISWALGPSQVGWVPDNRRFWFHSEESGFSHLYTVDVQSGSVSQLTAGDFEVESAQLSRDGRSWYLQTSEGSPYERHAWRMPVDGGARERLTTMEGRHDFSLHPDEHILASLFSTSNRPPEVYLQPAQPGAAAERVTYSPTEEWLSYPWREAEIIEIPASDGVGVPAIIHRPENPNGAAVLFVHGAGYLQNVHRWWSQYFRETMFHHLLADMGYLVLDLDFRASRGYGRDWRTAVYRHMGGRDLQDYVDASVWVREQFGIPPERVGIYGGSYGGFITLMALFTEPEHFGAGAALRAVTDWAHYNDPYTSNILNYPTTDPEAFARSSPINFAAGLQDPLLMTHGLIDVNVQPQDIFRLSQRLIELGKTDWELAMYPVEDHGFVEPTSWTDQYRRILELFERHLH